jgi:hypothetical protein
MCLSLISGLTFIFSACSVQTIVGVSENASIPAFAGLLTLPESLPLLGPCYYGGILVEFLLLQSLTCSNRVSVFLMRLCNDADNIPAAPGVSVIDGIPAVAS